MQSRFYSVACIAAPVILADFYFGFCSSDSTGSPASFQPSKPPSNAAAFVIPFSFSVRTAPALECSFGQEQYSTISLSFGSSLICAAMSEAMMLRAPLI